MCFWGCVLVSCSRVELCPDWCCAVDLCTDWCCLFGAVFWCRAPGLSSVLTGGVQLIYARMHGLVLSFWGCVLVSCARVELCPDWCCAVDLCTDWCCLFGAVFWCHAPELSSVLTGVVQLIYARIGVVFLGLCFGVMRQG